MAGSGVFPKTATLDTVYQGDYNLIQSTIAGVLSTYYGRSMLSSQLAANPVITATEWDSLRQDINKCYKHITNADSNILDVDPQDVILAVDANAYKVAADYCETNKATVAAGQLAATVYNDSITGGWNGERAWSMFFNWASEADANYWFNTGGYVVCDMSGANAVSSKDLDWQDNILNAIPSQTFTRSNWVSTTNIDVYEYGNAGVYSENYARIIMRKNSATQLEIQMIVNDADAGDQTGIGPAVDETVDTDVLGSISVYSSTDAVVAPAFVNITTPITWGVVTSIQADILVVGGGGAGGAGWPDNIGGGGGGGGGGGIATGQYTLTIGNSYAVTVGAGGIQQPYPTSPSGAGNSSLFSTLLTAGGGGGGAGNGGTGGSGGTPNGAAGGGYNTAGGTNGIGGGGGGGGSDDIPGGSGPGGAGALWAVNGTYYAGGGGGGADYSSLQPGGAGGGGTGGSGGGGPTAGQSGLGGGGGGGGSWGGGTQSSGADGGSGVVIISYTNGSQLFTGGTVTTSGGRYFHTFTASGTLT